jgi:hypothetical protein
LVPLVAHAPGDGQPAIQAGNLVDRLMKWLNMDSSQFGALCDQQG